MSEKKVLRIFGVILIVVQIISFLGMSKMYVGLYPDGDDLLYHNYSTVDSGLSIRKALFAIEAGVDRFKSGFENLKYSEDEYRIMTATQMTSAMIRESLDCSTGGSFGLIIYDTILTISFSFTGLLGIGLLIFSSKIKNSKGESGDRQKSNPL